MSQTVTHLGSPVRWLAVNGSFAVCAVMATVGENRFALWVIVFLTYLYLLGGCLNIVVPGVLKAAAKRVKVSRFAMVLDLVYDFALLTLFCVYCEWYVWLMYLVAAVISAYELMTVRAYATQEKSA